MNIDWHRLFHLCQIGPVAICGDYVPVGTCPLDVKLVGNHFTHHADHRSTIDEDGKLVPINVSGNNWRVPGEMEFGVSGVISQTDEGRNLSDSKSLLCGWGHHRNMFVFGD